MHKIQKLELIGFKSFCDRSQLTFKEGITAIVGPNGCGKSNIADAISWVVGEQSAKTLRTDRMEGVIFNGTQARKSTSMAEVVLTLSLSESFAVPEGMDLNPDGFTVGRRLYRSGESEYYLDGRRSRLRDIQALFEGTGLGPNSYALIEQGRIGQILSSKPADRRSLIEEAARITLFKSRRYSAEVKLEMAQQNLLRINDIIREVARQLNSLKRQAAKARRYGRLREELRAAHKLRLAMEQRRLDQDLLQCAERLAAAQELERTVLEALAQAEKERASGQEACRKQELRVNDERERLSGLKLDAERASNLRRRQDEQKTELVRRLEDAERESVAMRERADLVEKERARLRLTFEELVQEIEREQQLLESERARRGLVEEAIQQAEAGIEELRSFLMNRAGQLADLRNLQARCGEQIERIEARTGRLESERSQTVRERDTILRELEAVKKEAAENSAIREELARSQVEGERRGAELARRLEESAAEATALQDEYGLLQHRHSSLEEVERRRSNYSEGVQKFLSTRLPGEEERRAQTLADFVETDPRYEAAVEDYLNDALQYILVDGIEDAVRSVERLKRIGAGKCTFLTLRNGETNGNTASRPSFAAHGVIGYLEEILRMREDVRRAFERALPEFASTVIVDDLNTAFRVAESHPGASFLTLDGESYSTRGTLSAVGERKAMAGFLTLKREKRELEGKLKSMRGRIDSSREQIALLKREQAESAESLKAVNAEAQKCEIRAVGLQHKMGGLESEVRKMEQTETVTQDELAQLMAEKAEVEARLKKAVAGLEEIEGRSRTGEEDLRGLVARLDSLKTENASLSQSLASLLSAHAVRHERKSSLEADVRRLANEADEVGMKLGELRSERDGIVERLAGLDRETMEIEARIRSLTADLEAAEASQAASQKELTARREALDLVEEDLRRFHREREEAMEARSRVEIEKTRLENDLAHLARSCQDEFHVPLQEVVAQIQESDWQRDFAEVCEQHEQIRTRLEQFGAVNMRALEEYQELDERYQFQNGQRADIEQSIADTQRAIADINRRSLEQFQAAFTQIRENFTEVFQILFKGGQCDLRLLDEEDVLESGIDIIAQPPGKRLQNVLLLSGGEKALTALALLIAIFRYRPSPFCVLDEVDAPLDDANIQRFTQLIMELSKETQFILITHNKKTMEIAQTLYGVTMEEPGISKLVGVEFGAEYQARAS